ncbi:MAG: PLP-dependent aminotransferase family protein, partial [Lachnospiraceae bacterium]|nr:PLP-dependent aminotransferase family protein [Lachnospiraceae bacterium]
MQVAERMKHIKGSVIRQFAEAALKPGLISFANGNPSPVTFPVEDMKRFYQEALDTGDNKLFTYGSIVGYPPLVQALKERLAAKYGFDFEKNDLFIVSGGTQAVDIVSKLWISKGDGVIVEEPSYSSCYNIFLAYEAKLLGVGIDESGIDTDAVEEILKTHPEVRMIYTISSFQNPTGYTAVQEKREKLYALACKYDKVILEDDPYTELRFSGESVNPIKSLDLAGRVFYTSSLSKVICPS